MCSTACTGHCLSQTCRPTNQPQVHTSICKNFLVPATAGRERQAGLAHPSLPCRRPAVGAAAAPPLLHRRRRRRRPLVGGTGAIKQRSCGELSYFATTFLWRRRRRREGSLDGRHRALGREREGGGGEGTLHITTAQRLRTPFALRFAESRGPGNHLFHCSSGLSAWSALTVSALIAREVRKATIRSRATTDEQ